MQTILSTPAATTPPAITTETVARVRMSYIDNLRILLTGLVILHHLSIGYGASGDWYYGEKAGAGLVSVIALSMFTAVNQAFFMGFFYMISSYMAPFSFDRKGAGSYLKDRLKRLGIPIVFFAVVIQPALCYVIALYQGFQGSFFQFISERGLSAFGVGPLWFVEALLIFSFAYALARLLPRSSQVLGSPFDVQAPGNRSIALFALVLGLITFVVRIAFPSGWWLEPLHLELAHFPQYIVLFAVGIIAYRHNWFASLSESQGRFWGRIALMLVPALLLIAIIGGVLEGGSAAFAGGLYWQALVFAVWEEFMCVAMIVFLLVRFRTRFNHQGRIARTLSEASYAVYVLHAPVIVLLAMALSPLRIEPGLKFILVAPLALVLAFAVGVGVKRLPFARNIL